MKREYFCPSSRAAAVPLVAINPGRFILVGALPVLMQNKQTLQTHKCHFLFFSSSILKNVRSSPSVCVRVCRSSWRALSSSAAAAGAKYVKHHVTRDVDY